MRTWEHAYNKNDDIVHIDDVSENSDDTFKCLTCRQKMSAKIKGQKKDKHFAHYNTENCSGESDLHKLAKKYFLQVYKKCLHNGESYFVEYPIIASCNYCNKYKQAGCTDLPGIDKFDLTNVFKNAILDEELKNFNRGNDPLKPDVLLMSEDETKELYIEINYTHPCSDEKKNSGKRIIEFDIKDERDLCLINKKYIHYDDRGNNWKIFEKLKVGMYNFKDKHKTIQRYESCYKKYTVVYRYKDGRLEFPHQTIAEYELHQSNEDIEFSKVLFPDDMYSQDPKAEIKEIIYAYKMNEKFKNCRICEFRKNGELKENKPNCKRNGVCADKSFKNYPKKKQCEICSFNNKRKSVSINGIMCNKQNKLVNPEDALICDSFQFFST